MDQFKLIPCDSPGDAFTLTTGNSAMTLAVARQIASPCVDVHRGGRYAFTLRRYGNPQPYWVISASPCAADHDQRPC